MEKLWTQGQIGTMTVKNRTVRSATNEHFATRAGELTEVWRENYLELARGGVGLIITGQFCVDMTQRADEGQPTFDADMEQGMYERSCDVLRRTCREIKAYDTRIVVQLSHSGDKAPESVNGCPGKGPSDFTAEELKKLARQFAFAAKTCMDCGVDGVQIHMAHGYLLSTFLDPATNLRTDEYGGSLENRYRLCGEVITAVREACGTDYPVLVKVDCDKSGDLNALLRMCKDDGVDCAEVSGLDALAKRGEEPFYLSAVVRDRAGVDLPICLVGGVNSLESMRRTMDAGIEFVSLARPLICEPDLIGKMERGERTEGRCVGCNQCFKVYRQRFVRCVFHEKAIPHLEQIFG